MQRSEPQTGDIDTRIVLAGIALNNSKMLGDEAADLGVDVSGAAIFIRPDLILQTSIRVKVTVRNDD